MMPKKSTCKTTTNSYLFQEITNRLKSSLVPHFITNTAVAQKNNK